MACSKVNCTSWPILQPNPDIAGIGVRVVGTPKAKDLVINSAQVVVSFLLSAYFTLGLVGVHFLIDAHSLENPFDRALRKLLLPKGFRVGNRDSLERWTRAVESTILAFSDTQLVTSLAILTSGYLQLSCGLSLYHWQTVVDLAWFSALTHLTTLTSLKRYFRSYPFMAACRVLVMGIVLILLSVAFVPTGYAWQRDGDAIQEDVDPTKDLYAYFMSSPAVCLFSPTSKDAVISQVDLLTADSGFYGYSSGNYHYNTSIVVLSLAYLLTSYGSRVIRISTPLAIILEKWLKFTPLYFFQHRYQSVKTKDQKPRKELLLLCCKALLLVIITMAEAFYETGNSMLWEIVWLSAALAWGTLRLMGLRAQSHIADEDQWGFGQVLPLVLSVLPIWWLFTLSFDSKRTTNAKRSQPRNAPGFPTMRKIKKTRWFRSLTSLIVGMVTVLASYLLFDLPGAAVASGWSYGIDTVMIGPGLGLVLIKYAFALVFCITVWTIFVCVCLTVHFRMVNGFQANNTRAVAVNAWRRQKLHTGLWCVAILTLLALQVAFIVTMLIHPAWLLKAIYM